jgi:hypothetical protein
VAAAGIGEVMAQRQRILLVVAVITLAAAAVGWAAFNQGGGQARRILEAHVAGVAADDAGYTRLGPVLRSRAWLLNAPSQPEGVALFTGLPDAEFGRERFIAAADLREALRRIRGLTWDGSAQAWSGGGRQVPLSEVRVLLEAAVPTPTDAAAVIDLLLGEPAPGAPRFADLLQADPSTLSAIKLVPFHGARGRLLVDRGRPPFAVAESSYTGLLASFQGAGWPADWRVLSLRSVEP